MNQNNLNTIKDILYDQEISNFEKVQKISQEHNSDLRKHLTNNNPEFLQENNKIILKIIKIETLSEVQDSLNLKSQIQTLLSNIGEVNSFEEKNPDTFHISFKDPVTAFLVKNGFDNLEFEQLGVKFQIHQSLKKKLKTSDYSPKKWNLADNKHSQKNNECHYNNANKFTCRYDVKIENDKNFQVAKKIIGSQGCNMKKIIEKSFSGSSRRNNDQLKLRLRGIGSGYKEGPDNKESQEPLHLCVSAKNKEVYKQACNDVESLLNKIYEDYLAYLKKNNSEILEDQEYLESLKFKRKEQNSNYQLIFQ